MIDQKCPRCKGALVNERIVDEGEVDNQIKCLNCGWRTSLIMYLNRQFPERVKADVGQ